MKTFLVVFALVFESCEGTVFAANIMDEPPVQSGAAKPVAAQTVESLASKVQKRLNKQNVTPYEAAMTALLKQWEPVGKTTDDVIALIGHADEADLEQMIYRFDNGLGGGSEWVFAIQNGKVTAVKHTQLEP